MSASKQLEHALPAIRADGLGRGYTVQWTTRDFGRPEARWGTASGALAARATGSFLTYTATDMCGAPANASGFVSPGALNYAIMAPLSPGTRYFYRVGDPVCPPSELRSCPADGPCCRQ